MHNALVSRHWHGAARLLSWLKKKKTYITCVARLFRVMALRTTYITCVTHFFRVTGILLFTNSYGSSICWRKQPDVLPANSWWRSLQMQRNLWEAGDSDWLTSSECHLQRCGYQFNEPARDRIRHAIAESIRRFWRKMQATADGKRRKKLELRLGLNCLLNQRRSISINQSFSYPPLFSGSELKYLSSIAKTELTYPPF